RACQNRLPNWSRPSRSSATANHVKATKASGPKNRATLMLDSHQHFWQVGRFDYPWMSRNLGVLYRDYLPHDIAPILAQNGVEKTVLVQASNSVAESRWLLELADANPFIAGIVGWVDLTDAGA